MLSRQLIVYFLLCLIAIAMVKEFTFSPEVFSGNGNPVILLFPFVILSFVLFGIEFSLSLKAANFTIKTWRRLIIVSLIIFISSLIMEFFFVKQLIHQLGGPPTKIDSRIYHYPWLNQYTNTLFVNFYTFLFYISTIVLCVSFTRLKNKS